MDKQDIHIRVNGDLMRRVRDYAERQGFTLAAAITVLLDQALKEES